MKIRQTLRAMARASILRFAKRYPMGAKYPEYGPFWYILFPHYATDIIVELSAERLVLVRNPPDGIYIMLRPSWLP